MNQVTCYYLLCKNNNDYTFNFIRSSRNPVLRGNFSTRANSRKDQHGVRILLMSKAVMVVYSAASGTTAPSS